MSEEIETQSELQPYLSFILGDESFVVPISQVREIIELYPVTKIPHSPDYLKGIINLRGGIVPVVDLRIKFSLDSAKEGKKTRIIIFEVFSGENKEKKVVGGIVDQTRDVISLDNESISEPPSLEDNENADFITGVFKHENEFLLLVDVNKILSKKELKQLEQIEMETK